MAAQNRGPAEGQLERVKERLGKKHADEEIMYTSCPQNGCFDNCLLKVHKKNGVITALEVGDDRMHTNMGREDEYCEWEDLREGIYQHRPCVRGRGWRKDVYAPTRIKYPMKRVGERGSREFKRISWDEACSEIARMYKECREKYGPYSVFCDGVMGHSFDPFGEYFEGGALHCWAIDSNEAFDFSDDTCFGIRMNLEQVLTGEWWSGSDVTTLLDSKLIILWGVDVMLNYTEKAYHQLLSRDSGVPLIVVEPRLTWTANLADQWIPIRPGTDGAMMEAMAYVIFEENLQDQEFIDKWVEPYGLERWKNYLYGKDDDVVKTPEWAESICGVPAETIADLARLYAKNSPCYFRSVWAVGRTLNGENPSRTSAYLAVICGNVGKYGTIGGSNEIQIKPHVPEPNCPNLGTVHGEHHGKMLLEAEQWHNAVLLREKVDAGEMTIDEYKGMIGCPLGEPAPDIHMIFMCQSPRNFTVNYQDANARILATKKTDYVVWFGFDWHNTTSWYCDIVCPVVHQFFEDGASIQNMLLGGYSFNQGFGQGFNNYFTGIGKIIDPPGECATRRWILKEVANKLGIGHLYAPRIQDVSREEFGPAMKELAHESYEIWKADPKIAAMNPPTWEEFLEYPLFRQRDKEYYVALKDHFDNDIPFKTDSGKIEFYSKFLAEADRSRKVMSGYKSLGTGDVTPIAKYKPSPEGMYGARVNKYPLYMISPHSYYRQHFCQENNPWFLDEHRRAVWISTSDAKARGIKDGDNVLVHNDHGQCFLPAYVTSRLAPGVCCMIFGRQYQPSNIKTDVMPDGIDLAGSCNFLINNEHYGARKGCLICNSLVEISSGEFNLTGTFE